MKRLCVIDGKNQAFRYWFSSEDKVVGALQGLASVLEDALFNDYYTYILVALDHEDDTWRHKLYPKYKAQRDPRPEELERQIPWLARVADCYSVKSCEVSGYEADDVIAGVVRKAQALGHKSIIISRDKDLMQLVDHKTRVQEFGRAVFGPAEVYAKFGVHPHQLTEYLALVGDVADNVPGVRGIGDKSARQVLWGGRGIRDALQELPKSALKTRLQNGLEDARLSYKLVRLRSAPTPELVELRRPQVTLSEARGRFEDLLKSYRSEL